MLTDKNKLNTKIDKIKIMDIKIQYIGLLLILIYGCNTFKKNSQTEIEKEIENLSSIEKRKEYLEEIFKVDQKIRDEDSEMIVKYEVDSDEYNVFVKKAMTQDSINIVKIEKYLEIYGHPQKDDYGEIATITPHMVIHHSPNYEDRVKNFEYFYSAYLKGDIDINMYLGRMYEMKFGERFEITGNYSSENEINQLIKRLNLEKLTNLEKN